MSRPTARGVPTPNQQNRPTPRAQPPPKDDDDINVKHREFNQHNVDANQTKYSSRPPTLNPKYDPEYEMAFMESLAIQWGCKVADIRIENKDGWMFYRHFKDLPGKYRFKAPAPV